MKFNPEYIDLVRMTLLFGTVALATITAHVYIGNVRRETKTRADRERFSQWRERELYEIEQMRKDACNAKRDAEELRAEAYENYEKSRP